MEVGHWELTDAQIAKFREYLLRGGFFMCDDFHGADEWNTFVSACPRYSRTLRSWNCRTTARSSTPCTIWATVTRCRRPVYAAQLLRKVPHPSAVAGGGDSPRWRGIYDDNGRLMVVICHNMDLGDSWENADGIRSTREVLGARHPHRGELPHVRDVALNGNRHRVQTRISYLCNRTALSWLMRI